MFWIFIAIVWVIAMGVGLWLVFHSYPDPDRIDVKRYAYRPQGLLAIGVASVVFLLATVFFSFAQVNTGHVGVVRTFGRISGQINPGISLIAPWQTYDSVNVQVQKQTFPDLTAFSAETQNVIITTTINYSVAPDGRARPDRRVGTDWFDRLVPNNLNQAFKDEAVKFTAVNIAPNREPIRAAVLKALRNRLSPYSIRVNDLNIDNIEFSKQFEPRSRPSRRPRRPRCAPRPRCSRRSSRRRASSPRPGRGRRQREGGRGPGRGQPQAQRLALARTSCSTSRSRSSIRNCRSPSCRPAATALIDPTKLFSGDTSK